MRYVRHREVIRRLETEGARSVEERCAPTDVMPATMRRGLDAVASEALIDAVGGDAVRRRTDDAEAAKALSPGLTADGRESVVEAGTA